LHQAIHILVCQGDTTLSPILPSAAITVNFDQAPYASIPGYNTPRSILGEFTLILFIGIVDEQGFMILAAGWSRFRNLVYPFWSGAIAGKEFMPR